MTTSLRVSDHVRVVFGEHKGTTGTVAAVAQCGHESYDQLWVHPDNGGAPVLAYRLALEPVSPPPRQARTQRFLVGDTVVVSNPARAHYRFVGSISHVFLDPFEQKPSTGASGHSARYHVVMSEFNVHEYYDWELEHVGTPL